MVKKAPAFNAGALGGRFYFGLNGTSVLTS